MMPKVGRGDVTVRSPHRTQISQFELFEFILLLNLDKQFPVEQFEASRAIRGNSVSVSSTHPAPLSDSLCHLSRFELIIIIIIIIRIIMVIIIMIMISSSSSSSSSSRSISTISVMRVPIMILMCLRVLRRHSAQGGSTPDRFSPANDLRTTVEISIMIIIIISSSSSSSMISTHVYIYIYIYIHTYVYMYIYVYKNWHWNLSG